MNFAEIAIRKRVVTLVFTFLFVGGGIAAFQGMSRLEDPEFTIKDALVVTPYPGASAAEVEEEVTDRIEIAIQELGQLKRIESKSDRGLSNITVTIQDKYKREALPQVWDELRRKVGDVQSRLPPGAGPSLVIDDFGDVFGVFVAVYGPEYSYAEIKKFTDLLRKELLLVQDVAKIQPFGERAESIYIELSRDRMAQLGVSAGQIADELRKKNLVADSGRVKVGEEFIALFPSGVVNSVEDFGQILITHVTSEKFEGSEGQIYLKDVGVVRRGYVEPQTEILRYDGNVAIGLGISTVSGGNVVTMGEALRKRVDELTQQWPLGIEVGLISVQSTAVTAAIQAFSSSLLQAVAIVIVVLLVFMGVRSGFLIGGILLITIIGSFVFLQPMGVALERISLGALIIALGMLVDNAIVIVDGVLVRLEKGQNAKDASIAVVAQSAMPLLGATVVAILAFAAIGTSDDATGEFCRSLFQVVLVSLSFSWLTAVTITPVLCVMFLKPSSQSGGEAADPYDSAFYRRYKGLLVRCIAQRWVTVAAVGGIFAASIFGFGFVDQSFFPPSTRPQFLVDLWMPQGTHIDDTTAQIAAMEEYLEQQDGVTHVSSIIGTGAPRFLLTYKPEKSNTAYGLLLVDVENAELIDGLAKNLEDWMADHVLEGMGYTYKFELGPGSNGKIRARFNGPDPAVLRRIASETQAIMHADPTAKAIRTDWRQRVKVIRPIIAEQQANLNGIQRTDITRTLEEGFQGARVGVFRDGDLLLPITMRATEAQRNDVSSIRNLQIWSPAVRAMIPFRQVISDFEVDFEDEIVWRRNRKRTITIFADPAVGQATSLFSRLRPQIEAIELPPGYALEWGGEYEDTNNAQAGIAASLPVFLLMMVLVTITLFNSLRQPLVIWLCVPLALIGVTAGLLLTGQPFGFMATLGFLSLIGMLIKNAVVLIDEINVQLAAGKPPFTAIIDSGASRLRPVSMAAATTALGMIPLLFDAFFASMAVTIIAGLIFATILTMVVLPVFYAIVFRVPSE